MEDIKKQEIEAIAWQVFLNKTGFRFIRELTPEEKLKISEVDSYAYYREQAEKIWTKNNLQH